MLTSVLEKVCQVVQDIKALELKNFRQNHMNSLKLAILDAELVKVDVKWLKNCHNELKVAVDHIKRYKSLVLSKRHNIEAIESKKTELTKLKSQTESLEFQISSLNDENESLDGEKGEKMRELRLKKKFEKRHR
ncbi:Phospholipase-like [Parasponia andersonii]|uniref:Phospholipase-like n=1 Tax=Parasponia andersonii TaxID=3476 RepID=A0A2P5DVY9_PARAD|nr:Phospholipase-like [Parasponia andersonii]